MEEQNINSENLGEKEETPPSQKHKVIRKKIALKKRAVDLRTFGARRQGRILATQALYQYDIRGGDVLVSDLLPPNSPCDVEDLEDEEESKKYFKSIPPKAKDFARVLVDGTISKITFIDDIITRHSTNWDIKRISFVDRAILRFSIYSLLFQEDIPRSAVIDEAVEVAKLFGEKKSYKFINGILDGIDRETEIKTLD